MTQPETSISTPAPAAAVSAARPWLVDGADPAGGVKAGYRHWLVYPTLAVMIGLLAYFLACFYAGAHAGVDQNGYLVTARLLLEKHTLHFVPANPYQFAGHMMITTEDGRIFAKYPFGFPLLAAIGRAMVGSDGMYVVNPLCTVIACLAAYFMFRTLVREFVALMGVIWLACNPLLLYYANDANSHASTICCVCVGFWALLSWLRNGSVWRGLLGGFALGYAFTIRYSEFLLVLPVAFASLSTLGLLWARGEMNRKRAIASLMPLLGWAIPIGAMALVCWVSFGLPWKTGYAYCKEDTGFAWKFFFGDSSAIPPKAGNWETFVTQINRMGLFFMWPMALLGLIVLPRKHWRVAITLALWIIPATLLYMCYYWAPVGENTIAYMRFFLSVVPGLLLAGLWIVDRAVQHLHNAHRVSLVVATLGAAAFVGCLLYYAAPDPGESGAWRYAIALVMLGVVGAMWRLERESAGYHFAAALAVGAITLGASFVNLWNILPSLESQLAGNLALRETIAHVEEKVAPDSGVVLFADENFCNQMDALGGYRLYSLSLFSPSAFTMFKRVIDDPEHKLTGDVDPNPLQRERVRFYLQLLGRQTPIGTWAPKPADEMRRAQLRLIDQALTAHERVAFLLRADQGKTPIPLRKGLEIRQLASWTNTPPVSPIIKARWLAWRDRAPLRTKTQPSAIWVLYEVVPEPPDHSNTANAR